VHVTDCRGKRVDLKTKQNVAAAEAQEEGLFLCWWTTIANQYNLCEKKSN